jgi:xanthine dehydrogenase accessory factor
MSPLQFYRSLRAELPAVQQWCLALVLHTQGSTPRKVGALMAIGADADGIVSAIGSIGGGLAEARVISAAQALLGERARANFASELMIDLAGTTAVAQPQHSGICGGSMRIALRCPDLAWLQAHCDEVIAALAAGEDVYLTPDTFATGLKACTEAQSDHIVLRARPPCLIGGGGHCGAALASVLTQVGFPVSLVDERGQIIGCSTAPEIVRFAHWQPALANMAGKTPIAVLLSRNYQQDLLALDAIAAAGVAFSYIGMMGSARRIRLVLAERPALDPSVSSVLRAPVGLPIGAETPMEIAISIAAELIQHTNASAGSR